jgi:hypothetical protein
VAVTLVLVLVFSWLVSSSRLALSLRFTQIANIQQGTLTAGQFAIYGDIKKALGATGGVEISN